MKADQGEKILRYQDLYKRYSRLGLSRATDRAMAIDGLQERILAALKVKGGFGVFFEDGKDGRGRGLLRRSLLWCRGADTDTLSRIQVPPGHAAIRVPSWSWMAYTGGIDYITPDFGGMEWEAMQSPWDSNYNTAGDNTLVVEARDYRADDEGSNIVFDCPEVSQKLAIKCVVLGKVKGRKPAGDKLHYVLVVQATTTPDYNAGEVYKRVGAGYLPGKCIELHGHMVSLS